MLGFGLLDEGLGGGGAVREPLEFTSDDLEALTDRGGERSVGVRDPAPQTGVHVRVEGVPLGGEPLEATALGLEELGVPLERCELLPGTQQREVRGFDLVPAPQLATASARRFRSPRPVSRICFAARFFRKPGTGNAGSISTV